jgi:predicted Zn-dependent peptidase
MSRPSVVVRIARGALLACALIPSVALAAGAPALPRPVERTLDNGLRVVVIRQPRLPLVQIQLAVPGGSSVDPPGLEGVAALTAQMLRHGTSSRTDEGFAADVDRLGGDVSVQVTHDQSLLTGAFLARDLAAGLELLSNAALDPMFAAEPFDRLRTQAFRALAQARGNPAALADEQVWMLAFAGQPAGHPLFGTPRSLSTITVESLRAYHRDVWRPDHAVLTLVGDVTPEQGFALAADWFGRWAGHAVPVPVARPVAAPSRPKLALVDLPGMQWAEVRMACVLPPRRAGDEALALATSALVGGPASRLGSLRGGIAGSPPRSSVSLTRAGGLLMIAVAVPVDSAAAAVRRLRAELRAFVAAPPAEAVLGPTRRASAAGFPLAFETLGGTLTQWQAARLAGLTPDELLRTPERLTSVRADSVGAAARRWLDPAIARVVVVGPADRLRASLAALGPLESVTLEPLSPLSRIAGGDTLTTPTPERLTRGRAALTRALEAHGGLVKLRGIADSEVESRLTIGTGSRQVAADLDQVRKEPYRMVLVSRYLTVQTRQVLDGWRGWLQSDPDSVGMPLDSLGVGGLRATFDSDLPHLLLAAADSAATVIWAGEDRGGPAGSDAVDVLIGAGDRRRYHLDRASGRLAGVDQYDSTDRDARIVARRTFSDVRPVDGIQWPFREERRTPGDNTMRLDVKSVRLNQGVSDLTFVRPVPAMR